MRNKFFKGAHLSEKEVKKIIFHFCEDCTATEISNYTGISRVTINSYLKQIREQIVRYTYKGKEHIQKSLSKAPVFTFDEQETEQNAADEMPYLAFQLDQQMVYVFQLEDKSIEVIDRMKNGTAGLDDLGYYQRHLQGFQAFLDVEDWKMLRFDAHLFTLKKTRGYSDDLDTFWALARNRLTKFRGINKNTMLLHLRESGFRYNYRSNDLFELTCQILRMNPLGQPRQSFSVS
jgi:transposase